MSNVRRALRRTFQRTAAIATAAGMALALLAAASGCASGSFYASNLPSRYKAPRFVPPSTADLARFAVSQNASDVIASGDVLEITIVSGAEDERPAPWVLRVDASGGLDLPLIGLVRVEGLQLTEAERLIRDESIRRQIYRSPHVAVVLKEPRKVRVTVIGEVLEPGTYEIPASQASIVTAIAAAGGMSEKADTKIALRNPTFATDVRLTNAEEPAEQTAKPATEASATAKEASKDEPAKIDDAAAEPAAAPANQTASSEKDEAKAKEEDEGDEKKPAPEQIAADKPKEDEQDGSAAKLKEPGTDSDTSKKEGDIQLASAEEPVDDVSATTAGYVESESGEVTIDLLAAGERLASLPVEDGAVVVVKERPGRTVQIMGLVKKPDRYEYPDDQELRLLDALALAGGRTMEIADSVKIIRQAPGEPHPIVILASVRYAKQGGDDNLALMPGDVVSVEETPVTFTVDTLRTLLRFGITTF